jgi:O-antigen/teichoic acid export membrane protein
MPLDRYTGVTLDVLNQPIKNFYKISVMLLIKVAGNLMVIYLIGEVWAVAVTSIVTFLAGVLLGIYYLKKSLDFSVKRLLVKGYSESKLVALKGLNKINTVRN